MLPDVYFSNIVSRLRTLRDEIDDVLNDLESKTIGGPLGEDPAAIPGALAALYENLKIALATYARAYNTKKGESHV